MSGIDEQAITPDGLGLTVGAQMRAAREQRGLSLTEMASRLGLSKTYLSNAERQLFLPSAKLIRRYEDELGCAIGMAGADSASGVMDSPRGNPPTPLVEPLPATESQGTLPPAVPDVSPRTDVAANTPPEECDVYLSGALYELLYREQVRITRAIYDRVGTICESLGLSYYYRRPSRNGDRQTERDPSTWIKEFELAGHCKLLVAYVGVPSFIVGAQIQDAADNSIPVVLLHEKSKPITRYITHHPAVRSQIVTFEDDDPSTLDLLLRQMLIARFSELYLKEAIQTGKVPSSSYAELIDELNTPIDNWRSAPTRPIGVDDWISLAKLREEPSQRTK